MLQDFRLKTYLGKLDNLFIAYPYDFKVNKYWSDILATGEKLGGHIIDECIIIFSSKENALLFNMYMAYIYLDNPLEGLVTVIDVMKSKNPKNPT